jgi:hypothetical protein
LLLSEPQQAGRAYTFHHSLYNHLSSGLLLLVPPVPWPCFPFINKLSKLYSKPFAEERLGKEV